MSLAITALIVLFEHIPRKTAVVAQSRALNYLTVSKLKKKFHLAVPEMLDSALAAPERTDAPSPTVEPPPAFYPDPIRVVLYPSRQNSTLRFTLDGSTPTRESARYQGPIALSHTAVLRFREFVPGLPPGPVITATYLIGNISPLPVISLVTEPANLWNKYSGIYENPFQRGQKWERLAHVEYFDDSHRRQLHFPAALRIHGNWTRKRNKKSFRLRYRFAQVAGTDVGNFLTGAGDSLERTVVLRAAAGTIAGTLRDELFNTLFLQNGGIASDSHPVALLLNGEFWGIYYLRERIDRDFLQRRFGPGEYDLLYKQRNAVEGNRQQWKRFHNFFRTADLSDSSAYRQFATQMDITNFIDFWAHNIYAANMDWPHVNLYVFRERRSRAKWRWISWDADATFWRQQGMKHNTFAWAARDSVRHDLKWGKGRGHRDRWRDTKYSTIFRKALANREFRAAFVTRFCDLLNAPLHPSHVEAVLDEIVSTLSATLPLEMSRWSVDASYFSRRVREMREFIAKRPAIILEHIRQELHLGELKVLSIQIQPVGSGSVKLNSITPRDFPWQGRYFPDFPLTITALPAPGFRFSHWSGIAGDAPEMKIHLRKHQKLTAHFIPESPLSLHSSANVP